MLFLCCKFLGIMLIDLIIYIEREKMPRPIKQGKNIEVSKAIVENGKDKNFHLSPLQYRTQTNI